MGRLKAAPSNPANYITYYLFNSIHNRFNQALSGRQHGLCNSVAIHVAAYHMPANDLAPQPASKAGCRDKNKERHAMRKFVISAIIAGFLAVSGGSLLAQKAAPPLPGIAVQAIDASYADIADLVTISPLIIDATVRNATKISAEQAVGVPANLQRMMIEADVTALIRGQGGVASRVKFLLDVPKDAKGKLPKLKKQRLFILGNTVTGRPGEIRLSRPDALIQYSAANDALLRKITQETVKTDAPPKVIDIISAFHSAGTVIGEGETQIFLKTERDTPMSLSIISRPGQDKRWAVSTSEVIDEAASAPQNYTLLWYRLACGLPRTLSPQSVEAGESDSAARAQADYSFVIESLGPCGRKRQ